MKHHLTRAAALLALTAVLLTGSASALFGKKAEEPAPAEGAPQVWDLEIRTYRGIPGQGQFLASDPEGEEMTFALLDEPRKGVVVIEGDSFTYTPDEGITGSDRFTYTATDSQGHTSAPAKVRVTIDKTRSGVTYSDTEDSPAACAAQELAEKGIFTGGKIGGHYYFQPDQPVTRSEFLAMALETAGREVTDVTMTGFCDDTSIPTWAKAYAAAGAADGIVRGSGTAEGVAFRGGEAITFNEAATILDRMLDLGDVDLDVWYADRAAAPSWAAQAVGNMEAVNVLSAGSFGSQTMEQAVTRADAAQMLAAAGVLLEGEEQPKGLFSWLG
ncbi:Ig-like domain-containing protein [uncultured Oscillibacter sp.]|uniref:Ig-like domain-containing protein n=1 Tax=uncultured Oscillibacter sp. TaxID=876091 RepID=UPI0025FC3744|nr:Ig-like domain-containing protein [uncultured Oscillibacter sp.]